METCLLKHFGDLDLSLSELREGITFCGIPMVDVPWFLCIAERVGRGLLAQILRDCEISREDLQKEI